MPQCDIDPLVSYKKYIQTPKSKLKISKINNNDLDKIFKRVNKSRSTSFDNISMITLMKLRKSLQKLILHLVNQVIQTKIFPQCLKMSKIIPIKKNSLEDIDHKNFRPINLLSPL